VKREKIAPPSGRPPRALYVVVDGVLPYYATTTRSHASSNQGLRADPDEVHRYVLAPKASRPKR
jgi:hypothetical protein